MFQTKSMGSFAALKRGGEHFKQKAWAPHAPTLDAILEVAAQEEGEGLSAKKLEAGRLREEQDRRMTEERGRTNALREEENVCRLAEEVDRQKREAEERALRRRALDNLA